MSFVLEVNEIISFCNEPIKKLLSCIFFKFITDITYNLNKLPRSKITNYKLKLY